MSMYSNARQPEIKKPVGQDGPALRLPKQPSHLSPFSLKKEQHMQTNMRFKMRQVTLSLLLGLSVTSLNAAAEEALPDYTLWDAIKGGKNMTNFRLRYEHVDQEGKPENARALTLRSLIGWRTAPFHNFSVGVQIINVAELENRYDDRRLGDPEKGMGDYPVVVDPHDTDINQLYVDWTGIKNTRFRLGRQQINLDNVRFIGDIGFRQVMQVFDGYSMLNKSLPDTEIYLAHLERVKQISTRLQEGELEIVNVKYRLSPAESITGYGYFSNFETPTMAKTSVLGPDTDQSNKTLGLRLDGSRKINDDWRWLYTAEYAKQTDYSDGDDRRSSPASRAAIPFSLVAAARRCWRCGRPASRPKSFPASPAVLPCRPVSASR